MADNKTDDVSEFKNGAIAVGSAAVATIGASQFMGGNKFIEKSTTLI